MKKTVLIPLPSVDFDPTEVSVPWRILKNAGITVTFATPDGNSATADPIMVTGDGLGPLKYSARADGNGRRAYEELRTSGALGRAIAYSAIEVAAYDGVILPGGHAQGMKVYLESQVLQQKVAGFFAANKPVGAICHGVVLAARSKDTRTGLSVLHGRKTTALPNYMELLAYNLSRLWMGTYYLTYPGLTVQDEVTATLQSPEDFVRGPLSFTRDSESSLGRGFVVQDGFYLSARWPGDAHLFGREFLRLLTQ